MTEKPFLIQIMARDISFKANIKLLKERTLPTIA
jgi:hypothetical protein